MGSLPVLPCQRARFGPLAAFSSVAPWERFVAASFVDTVTGQVPVQGTQIRAGWDSTGLRLLFEATDAMPWATLTERDAPLYKEEVVEVFIDPEGDGESYFEFEVNPNNAVLDLCVRRIRSGYRKDFRWSCEGLQTAVQLVPGGWNVEMAIPFLSLGNRVPNPGEKWRVNFTRIDRPEGRPRELTAWHPTGLAQFHVPQKFGVLSFQD